jgi:hypothetical protein
VKADEGWKLTLAAEASGGSLYESDEAGASVTFAFQGNSLDLVARRGPEEGRLLVTHDGRNVPGLPVDNEGRSYVDLTADAVEWQAKVPIGRGLGPGQHVVRLTLSDGTPCSVDGFVVNTGERPPFPGLPVAGLGGAMIVAVAFIALDRRRRPRREHFF